MRKRIYISGPLTSSGNELENVDRAVAIARELIETGFAPFCPHLSLRVDPIGEYAHDVWMQVDLPWVAVSDAMIRMPGESRGSDIEVAHATIIGVPVFRSVAELVEHFAGSAAA